MDIVLAIVRYVFVATILLGGGLVLRALVQLARDKRHPTSDGENS